MSKSDELACFRCGAKVPRRYALLFQGSDLFITAWHPACYKKHKQEVKSSDEERGALK